jgi:outer membrane protein
MSIALRGVAAAVLLATTALSAQAADLGYKKPGVLPALTTFNPWMIRVRAIAVLPGDTNDVRINGGAKTSGLKISDSVVPELDITYFFTQNIAAELILGTSHHNIKGKNGLAAVGKVGSTWVLPPTLTLQYHFTNFGAFKPYIGAGVNLSIFYGENPRQAGGFHDLKLSTTVGVAGQVGFDYMITKNWGWNVDVKRIMMRPTAKVGLGAANVKAKVNLDPWVIGTGITYKF